MKWKSKPCGSCQGEYSRNWNSKLKGHSNHKRSQSLNQAPAPILKFKSMHNIRWLRSVFSSLHKFISCLRLLKSKGAVKFGLCIFWGILSGLLFPLFFCFLQEWIIFYINLKQVRWIRSESLVYPKTTSMKTGPAQFSKREQWVLAVNIPGKFTLPTIG